MPMNAMQEILRLQAQNSVMNGDIAELRRAVIKLGGRLNTVEGKLKVHVPMNEAPINNDNRTITAAIIGMTTAGLRDRINEISKVGLVMNVVCTSQHYVINGHSHADYLVTYITRSTKVVVPDNLPVERKPLHPEASASRPTIEHPMLPKPEKPKIPAGSIVAGLDSEIDDESDQLFAGCGDPLKGNSYGS